MWRRLLEQLRTRAGPESEAATETREPPAAVAVTAKPLPVSLPDPVPVRPPGLSVALDSAAHTWLFRLPRNRAAITDFCAMIEKRLPPGFVSVDMLRSFQVAFDELLTNVVMHVTEFGDEPIEVLLKRDPDRVSAVVRYRGALFDPTRRPAPDTDAPIADRPIGGLGVHLVRTMMDDFRHAYVAGFNELTLVKRY